MNSEHLMPPVYGGPMGLPFFWADEVTGELSAAVMAYLDQALGKAPLSRRHLILVRAYLKYWINAPCWLEKHPSATEPQYSAVIRNLRDLAPRIEFAADIGRFLDQALEVGIDPL